MKTVTLNFFFFVVFLFLSSVSSQLSSTQKSTMINLSELLHSQVSSFSWDINTDPCKWSGVTCNNVTSNVTKLSLSNLRLTDSSFLTVACQIQSLEVLDVSKNLLNSIPNEFLVSCSELSALKSVNFSWNTASGPLPSFENGFASLEALDLSYNSLSGNIGAQLNALVGLKSLNLSSNCFNGYIPFNLRIFKGLEQLQLSANQFRGTIPEDIAEYKNLTVLDLSSNNLTGSLPNRVAELPKLEVLVLSANMLSGVVPDNLTSNRRLQRFAANRNKLHGGIPSRITRFLKNLDLSYNNLSESIPYDLLSQPNLQTVDLSYNMLAGTIPGNISSSLVRVRLGGNLLGGPLSSMNFKELQNLIYLELENNNFSGPIPADLGLCQKLNLLNLAGNQLSGNLPEELGNLKKLQVLSLQFNHFAGKLPDEITQLSTLTSLNISWNSLSGSIPQSIGNLSKLEYLHLQENNFSGSIPQSIGNLNSIIELQLGKNHLSGMIPLMPKTLQYALNLSNNDFEGQIPAPSLDQMTSLEILDLSNNRFTGKIPTSLTRMQSLTLLLLDNNHLSGLIPTFIQNITIDTKGNAGLIHPPAESPNTNHPTSNHRKRSVAVKIAVVISAALFGGLVAILGIFLSRRLIYKVHDIEMQPKQPEFPIEAGECQILTTSSTHKSNIDFNKAMEAVSDPLNLVLKTKFSTYYKAAMPSGVSYFVKKLNCTDRFSQLSTQGSFGQELEALGKVNSSNIMTPLAYTLAADSAYLIYELAFTGTLFDVLHRSSGTTLDWASRCSIAVGVAQGLASLHGSSSSPILLLDLTSKTIMLKSIKEAQIGDIELCKVIDPSKSTSSLSTVAGSVGYIPPEYAYTMRVTLAGNVYSFGVILLELLTGKQAVNEGTELAKWVLKNSTQPQKWDRILDFRISRTSPSVRCQMLAVLRIALACINASSEARPKMKSVLRMLLNAR